MFRLGRLLILFVLLALIGYGLYNMALITIKKYALQKQILELQAQAAALDQKHADLKKFLDSFENTDMLEQQLKARLNLKKEGEQVVVIVPNDSEKTALEERDKQSADQLLQNLTAFEANKKEETPNWQKWWDTFFGPP